MRVRRIRRDEQGAFIVIWALLIVALFTMVAIVIDLGQLRVTRRDNQSVSDFAALAAGEKLGSGQSQAACNVAWNYLKANAKDLPTGATSPCSGSFVCPDPLPLNGTQFPASGTGDYTIFFTYPVTKADIADARFTSGVGASDGSACERMGVTVKKVNATLFANVLGIKNLSTTTRSVVKATILKEKTIPSLWLLDPDGCTSLDVSGGSQINVGKLDNPATPTDDAIAGLITIDSDATGSTCSNTKRSMEVQGNSSHVWAIPLTGATRGAISLKSMAPGASSCTGAACDQGDVSSGRVAPQPTGAEERATRAPVDWVWNCKSTEGGAPVANPGSTVGPPSAYPDFKGIVPITNCTDYAIRDPYIDQLRAFVNPSGQMDTPFIPWTGPGSLGYSCAPNGLIETPAGTNVWINCANFSLGNGSTVRIKGNVVMDGGLSMTNGSTFEINVGNSPANFTGSCLGVVDADGTQTVPPDLCPTESAASAAWLYMRNGDMNITGGSINFRKTMVYLNNGTVKLNAAGPTWTSPDDGAFRGLSLWSEKETDFSMAGNGTLDLEGTFFTPNAIPFKLTGGGGFFPLQAQFISYHLDVSGGGLLNLVPNLGKGVSLPPRTGVLIR
jgi:Flp pilus assembly protein TadG